MHLYTYTILFSMLNIQLISAGILYSHYSWIMDYDEPVRKWENFTCAAQMTVGEVMIMTRASYTSSKVETVGVLTVAGLDNVVFAATPKYRPATWSYSEITSDSTVNASFGYYLPKINRTHTGLYQCQLNDQVGEYRLRVYTAPHTFSLFANVTPGLRLKELVGFNVNDYPGSMEVHKLLVDSNKPDEIVIGAAAVSLATPAIHWYNLTDDIELGTGRLLRLERDIYLNGSKILVSAVNDLGYYNATIIISMQYAPRAPILSGTEFYPQEGGSVAVRCLFDAFPAADITFVKLDVTNNFWKRAEEYEGDTLYLNNIVLERDVGMYLCLANNIYGDSNGTFFIHGKPEKVDFTITGRFDDSVDVQIEAKSATQVAFHITVTSVDQNNVTMSTTNVVRHVSSTLPNIEMTHSLHPLKPNQRYTLQIAAVNSYGNSTKVGQFITNKDGVRRPVTTIHYTTEKKGGVTSSSTRVVFNLLLLMAIVICL